METKTMIRKLVCAGLAWMGLAAGSASAQATIVEYVHTDALGSPVATTDASGNVIERQVYEPYGAPIAHGPTNGPGFTGHVEDSATGLTYMQQRYYDPALGVFLSVDPVAPYQGSANQFSRYRFGNGNPYRFIDPDGRQSWSITGTSNVLPVMNEACQGNIQCMRDAGTELAAAEVALVSLAMPDLSDVLLAKIALRNTSDAFKIADGGGRHARFLKQQLDKSMNELRRSLRSQERLIKEHKDKIANPEKYMHRDDRRCRGT